MYVSRPLRRSSHLPSLFLFAGAQGRKRGWKGIDRPVLAELILDMYYVCTFGGNKGGQASTYIHMYSVGRAGSGVEQSMALYIAGPFFFFTYLVVVVILSEGQAGRMCVGVGVPCC